MITYEEQVHKVVQGDSYRSLSKQFCGSEEYAAALQAYNLELPGNRQPNNGQLLVGEPVHIPSNFKLERSYGNLIETVRQERAQGQGREPLTGGTRITP